jgi:hypothetical protein
VSEPQHHAGVERAIGERARGLDAVKSDRRLKPAIPKARRETPGGLLFIVWRWIKRLE